MCAQLVLGEQEPLGVGRTAARYTAIHGLRAGGWLYTAVVVVAPAYTASLTNANFGRETRRSGRAG